MLVPNTAFWEKSRTPLVDKIVFVLENAVSEWTLVCTVKLSRTGPPVSAVPM